MPAGNVPRERKNRSPVIATRPYEPPHLSDVAGRCHFPVCLNLFWVRLDPFPVNGEPQVLCLCLEKNMHFFSFMLSLWSLILLNTARGCDRCSSGEALKIMMSSRYGMAKSSNPSSTMFINSMNTGARCSRQTKGHDQKLKKPSVACKSCFLPVSFVHQDLPISRFQVQRGEIFGFP